MTRDERLARLFDRSTALFGALYMALGVYAFIVTGSFALALSGASTIIFSSAGLWWRRRSLRQASPGDPGDLDNRHRTVA